jgi:hypothetical protein
MPDFMLDSWLHQLRPPPDAAAVLDVWLRQLVDRTPVDTSQPSTQRRLRMRDDHPGGLRLPAATVLAERLRIASDMLLLALRDAAVLPTRQQEDVREACKRLAAVQAWCKVHANGRRPG